MMIEPTKAQIEAAQRAVMISDGCGLTIEGERVFCDDPRAPPELRIPSCECKEVGKAALLAAFRLSPAGEWGKVDLLLQMMMSAGGRISATDEHDSLLNYFCNDSGMGQDTFNRAISLDLIRVTHDSTFETSTAFLTDKGKEAIRTISPPQPELSREEVVEQCAKVAEAYAAKEKATEAEPDDGISLDSLAAGEAAGLVIADRIRALSPPQPDYLPREAEPKSCPWCGDNGAPGCDGRCGCKPTNPPPPQPARPNADVPSEDEFAQVLHDNNYHPTPWDQAIEPYKSHALSDARAVHAFLIKRTRFIGWHAPRATSDKGEGE